MEKNFVTFYSPGTFVAENTTQPIEKWDLNEAMKMARGIKERYNATPYGFQFSTRRRDGDELDSREVKCSNMYYLGGRIYTLEELERENNPDNRILISNMRCNGWKMVIVNTNSWKWTQPLKDGDIVLAFNP